MQLGGAVLPCSGADKSFLDSSSSGTWEQRWPGPKHQGPHPSLPWGQAAEGTALLLAVLSSQGHCIVALQFPPFLLRLETYPLPLGLLRKLLSLSPQVIFRHVALKSWALLGEGAMGPINPILAVEGRLGDLFGEQEGPTGPKVASERVVPEQFFERRLRNQ